MKRIIAALAIVLGLVFVPATASAYSRPAPRPVAAVSISATETCGPGGYTYVTVTLKANKAGAYDVSIYGDSVYQSPGWVDYVELAAGESYSNFYGLSFPQQVDVQINDDVTWAQVAEKSLPAPTSCTHGW